MYIYIYIFFFFYNSATMQNRTVVDLQIFLQYQLFTSPDVEAVLAFYAKLNQHMSYTIPNVNALSLSPFNLRADPYKIKSLAPPSYTPALRILFSHPKSSLFNHKDSFILFLPFSIKITVTSKSLLYLLLLFFC